VLCDRPGPALDRVGGEIAGSEIVPADLSDRFEVERLARRAGPVDILCDNAGLQHVGPIESFPPQRWDRILVVMLTAPSLLIQRLSPSICDRVGSRAQHLLRPWSCGIAEPSANVTAKHGLSG
jgi:3-hydroxybutyrate dehydrogenase